MVNYPIFDASNKSKETNMDGLNQLFTIVQTEEHGEMRLRVEVDEEKINIFKEEIKDTVLQDVNVKRVVHSILNDAPLGNDSFFDLLNRPLSEFGTENASTFIEAAHLLSDAYKNETSLDKSDTSIELVAPNALFAFRKLYLIMIKIITTYLPYGDFLKIKYHLCLNNRSFQLKIYITTQA